MLSHVQGLIVFAALVLCIASAQRENPAEQSAKDPLRIAGSSNGKLKLTLGRTSSTVDLSANLSGCWGALYDGADRKSKPSAVVLSPRVLDEVQKNGVWYVTAQVSLNGGCNVNGMCGASTTVNLIWLKLSQQLAVLKQQFSVVQNCIDQTELTQWVGRGSNDVDNALNPKLELRNGVLEIVFETSSYANKVKTISKLRYEHRAPDKGLQISSQRVALK